jgi:hypothetical protein
VYEADLNFFQEFIFSEEAINALTDNRFLSKEHFDKKRQHSRDLSRQARYPMAEISLDAVQCC